MVLLLLWLWKGSDRGACGIRSHTVSLHGFGLKGVMSLCSDVLDSGGDFVSASPPPLRVEKQI